MRYTFADFRREYPDDDACLDAVFRNRYGNLPACPKCGVVKATFHRVKKRKCYSCAHCGGQLYPLADTIFRKSNTSLWNWFYAIYLFSTCKNGVSAKELQRHLSVTYKTAWRMAKQIRKLMCEDIGKLGGGDTHVEVDETALDDLLIQASGGREDVTVVCGLADLGIAAIAYRLAQQRGWKTFAVARARARKYRAFPVDGQEIIESMIRGSETATFLGMCHVIVRVGGGQQAIAEVATFKSRGGTVYEYDLATLPS